jgi:hypothetical protein
LFHYWKQRLCEFHVSLSVCFPVLLLEVQLSRMIMKQRPQYTLVDASRTRVHLTQILESMCKHHAPIRESVVMPVCNVIGDKYR